MKELTWFEEFFNNAGGYVDAGAFNNIRKIRSDGHALVKCSTTTIKNSKYMTANYCMNVIDYCNNTRYTQNFAIYNSMKVDEKFDGLQSREIKAIRGFVRYDKHGKNDSIRLFSQLYASLNSVAGFSHAFDVTLLILSFYVKGECMAEEAEYRHLLLTNKTVINSLTINEVPVSGKNSFRESALIPKKNKYYCNHENCGNDSNY